MSGIPFHQCKTLPLQLRYDYLQAFAAGVKLWEGRLLASVLQITRGRFPCPRCTVCLFTGSKGTLRCAIAQIVLSTDLTLITADNYISFIPCAESYIHARAVYAAMGPGPYIFLRLRLP